MDRIRVIFKRLAGSLQKDYVALVIGKLDRAYEKFVLGMPERYRNRISTNRLAFVIAIATLPFLPLLPMFPLFKEFTLEIFPTALHPWIDWVFALSGTGYHTVYLLAFALISVNAVFIVSLRGFLSKELEQRIVRYEFVTMIACGAANILLFSGFYYFYGVTAAGKPITNDFATSIYFSVVTWTTLGYGDLSPVGSMRFVAATEALVGYVYMALLIGLFSTLFRVKVKAEVETPTEEK